MSRKGPRPTPGYITPPLTLTEKERTELSIRLWRARTDLLLVAPLLPAWSSRLLCHAKSCIAVVDKLTPDPMPRGQADDE